MNGVGNWGATPRYLLLILLLFFAGQCRAGVIYYGSEPFTLTEGSEGDAVVRGPDLIFTGPNSGSGLPGSSDLFTTASVSGLVRFDYLFTTVDIDLDTGDVFDWAGFLINDSFTRFSPLFSDTPTPFAFHVAAGQTYGFRIETADNTGEPGVLTISDFSAPAAVPEPGTGLLVLLGCAAYAVRRFVIRPGRASRLSRRGIACFTLAIAIAAIVRAQDLSGQYYYNGVDATGWLRRTTVTNVSETTLKVVAAPLRMATLSKGSAPEFKQNELRPQRRTTMRLFSLAPLAAITAPSLSVSYSDAGVSFLGLTHGDQRKANNGNQFSIEPPSQDIAVGKGYVLEGVNNAIQVYSTSGAPFLPKVLSTNELFGVPPAVNRTTMIQGVYPTDMRVFYDHGIDRWFVMQRAQDNDAAGNPLSTSHLYLAVSQTGDPTGLYNIYVMETTNLASGCPCFADFPQIAADQYAVHISLDMYDSFFVTPRGVSILAISKKSLAAGADAPVMQAFTIPRLTGFESTIRPAMTPPNASYFLASGGVEFFVSSNAMSPDNRFALWALTNTASLDTTPSLTLIQRIIPGMSYAYPDVADQRPGPTPYGSTTYPPGRLAVIDGGRDSRLLSLAYSGGRLYLTLATQARDENGKSVVAGGYAILSPTYRSGKIAAAVLRQGYLIVKNNHVLRPAVAVNPLGKGAIAFTIVGPDYYPSAAFLPIETFTTGTTARVAGVGVVPEDGFSSYITDMYGMVSHIARWGDYSGAVATGDGSIWMVGQYTPSLLRSPIPSAPGYENWAAHWATRVIRYAP